MRYLGSQRGMTLIEIMMVLIILGIVGTFLLNKVVGAGDKAKADMTQLMMQNVASAVEQYRLRYNGMPSGMEDLIGCTERTGSGCVPLLNEDAIKDAWGNRMSFTTDNGGRTYIIKSLGADGRAGGSGVDSDFERKGP